MTTEDIRGTPPDNDLDDRRANNLSNRLPPKGEPPDPSCYVCGHAPEEHHNSDSECEFEDGCDCICFEARE